MSRIAVLIICVGFLVSSLAAVASKDEIYWPVFLAGLVVSVVGIFIKQRAAHQEATVAGKLSDEKATIERSLAALERFVTELDHNKENLNLDQIRKRIEQHAHGPIEDFVRARKSLIHLYDLQFYANLMTDFCAGERYLNRCWSASVDGYQSEVYTYVGRAREQFMAAHRRLKSP